MDLSCTVECHGRVTSHRQMSASRSTKERQLFQKNTESLPTRSSSCFHMHRMIHMHSATTMPALLLQEGNLAMYCIGSYAVPQILSVNPDMQIDSFVFPANDNADEQVLNSGVDLQFSVMKDCKNKEAAYEVLRLCLRMKYSDLPGRAECSSMQGR